MLKSWIVKWQYRKSYQMPEVITTQQELEAIPLEERKGKFQVKCPKCNAIESVTFRQAEMFLRYGCFFLSSIPGYK